MCMSREQKRRNLAPNSTLPPAPPGHPSKGLPGKDSNIVKGFLGSR